MSGAGLLIVASHIIDPAVTTEEQYEQFYETERIPKTLSFDTPHRPKQGLRYKLHRMIAEEPSEGSRWDPASRAETCQSTQQFPNVALYPATTVAVLYSRVMGKHATGQNHGGPSKAFDGERIEKFVNFEDRMFRYIGRFDVDGMEAKTGAPKTLVLDVLDGTLDGPALLHGGFEGNYRPPERFTNVPSYRRTTLMKRLDKKGPRYMAMHEFTQEPDKLQDEVVFEWPEMNAVRAIFELKFALGDTILEL
ncbi:hypothetical protein K431DRAFT_82274 [Polychaeton citri CBS 116435]|uniref:Uncharacterized protein n=1 Tax=Polychaeton citri CBS 116435 TaxID=1314669 RepID=A0A9P4QEB4_9PEZI|nr:hypothetical protein K431DRAFT_82274 [Polychaeton citri CBS 116435]